MGGRAYQYNGLGQRVQQTVGTDVTKYLLDVQPGLFQVLAETKNEQTTRHIFDPLGGLHQIQQPNGVWQYPLRDGLGSVKGVSDANGNILHSSLYGPFGDPIATTGSPQTSYGFTGEPTDGSGVVYLRNRYYAPGLGVFTELDLLEGVSCTPQSINRYMYVQGRVITMIDPSGLIGENPNQWQQCGPSHFASDCEKSCNSQFSRVLQSTQYYECMEQCDPAWNCMGINGCNLRLQRGYEYLRSYSSPQANNAADAMYCLLHQLGSDEYVQLCSGQGVFQGGGVEVHFTSTLPANAVGVAHVQLLPSRVIAVPLNFFQNSANFANDSVTLFHELIHVIQDFADWGSIWAEVQAYNIEDSLATEIGAPRFSFAPLLAPCGPIPEKKFCPMCYAYGVLTSSPQFQSLYGQMPLWWDNIFSPVPYSQSQCSTCSTGC